MVQIYHIVFTYFSVQGHLGCFLFLAITNKASMNIVEHVSLWDVGTFFEYMPQSGIVKIKLLPGFWENSNIIFKVIYKFSIPAAMEECFFCSTFLPVYAFSWVFDSCSDGWKMETQSCFDLHFWLMTKDFELFFKCFSAILLLWILFSSVLFEFFLYFAY